jgi:hypothetical protein
MLSSSLRFSRITLEKNPPMKPFLYCEFTCKMKLWAAMFFYHFLYESTVKFKKRMLTGNTLNIYLSDETNCSPAQSRETISLILKDWSWVPLDSWLQRKTCYSSMSHCTVNFVETLVYHSLRLRGCIRILRCRKTMPYSRLKILLSVNSKDSDTGKI